MARAPLNTPTTQRHLGISSQIRKGAPGPEEAPPARTMAMSRLSPEMGLTWSGTVMTQGHGKSAVTSSAQCHVCGGLTPWGAVVPPSLRCGGEGTAGQMRPSLPAPLPAHTRVVSLFGIMKAPGRGPRTPPTPCSALPSPSGTGLGGGGAGKVRSVAKGTCDALAC